MGASRADITLAGAHGVQAAREVVRLVASVAGMNAVRAGVLERAIRDVEVLAQHAYSSEERFETVERVYLGLMPDFPFVGVWPRGIVLGGDSVDTPLVACGCGCGDPRRWVGPRRVGRRV
jgi:hypothetical protein